MVVAFVWGLTSMTGVVRAQDPAAVDSVVAVINVKDADLRDVLRTIGEQHNLNLMVDNRIDRRVTVRLAEVPVMEAVRFLCQQYGLNLSRSGQIWRIQPRPEAPPPPPPPLDITVTDSLLSIDVRSADLERVMRSVSEQSSINVMVRAGVKGSLTGRLVDVPVRSGLDMLLANNGFVVRDHDGVLHIDRAGFEEASGGGTRSFWVQVTDSLVTLDVTEAPIAQVIREIAAQMEVQLFTYAPPQGAITAKVYALTLDETLNLLLKGTNTTFRKQDGVYLIGNAETRGFSSTALVRLQHNSAEDVLELFPEEIRSKAVLQLVPQQNAIIITASQDLIVEARQFIDEVDHPTPQILIEALVVDFIATDLFELGLTFGTDAATSAEAADEAFSFGSGEGRLGGLTARADRTAANRYLNGLGNLVNIRNLGRLPQDFFVQLHALSLEGKANIRSRPQISTVNGKSASMSIGTTQYYILDTNTPLQSPNNLFLQQSQRFEKIEANVKLELTPWVSASGEVTTQIRPEFSSPVGEFDPNVPPTINSRVFDSTVRLRDGETIILGGLVEDIENVTYNKVPILGSIPLLGRLFRNTSRDSKKSELIIFLTPHVFYGDERDSEKWKALQDGFEHARVEDLESKRFIIR
ncbi:MAG: hypothetical protein AAF730_13130 [Bacteroidota bacterium]